MNNAIRAEVKNHDSLEKLISPVVFDPPLLLPSSAWTEHIPFAYWLIEYFKPALVVELGTHYGLSYFSFCQAVKKSLPATKCFAVDNWRGDEHAGFYDESVFEFVSKMNEQFNGFSTLLRSTFDGAINAFTDNSIDLLHIDGLHTYDAVKHDFDCWLPKISDRGIVLFHDTNVLERGFGVHKLWEELILQYPHFEFKHGFGLGILGIGKQLPLKLREFFNATSDHSVQLAIREVYERLGKLIEIEQAYIRQNEVAHVISEGQELIPVSFGIKEAANAVNDLLPIPTLTTQIFWKRNEEEYKETNSIIQTIALGNTKSDFSIYLEEELSSLEKIRIDLSDEKGIFYLHSISFTNRRGEVLVDWETIKKVSYFQNLIVFSSSLVENAFLFFSITNDPIIEIELSDNDNIKNENGINIIITASASSEKSVKDELLNITIEELRRTRINKIEKERDGLIMELRDQHTLFNKLIDEANQEMQTKEKIISDFLETQKQTKLNEAALRHDIQKITSELKTLTSINENYQKESALNKKLVELMEGRILEYKNKYDKKSIFGIIWEKIFSSGK